MTGSQRRVAFFCATYLKPEMLHVHRQIVASADYRPVVVTQKVENREEFPFGEIRVVRRSPWRFVGRAVERQFGGGPWQAGRGEVEAVLKILESEQIDLLHVFFGNVAVHWLPLFRRCPVPVVVSFHGADGTGEIATAQYREAREELFARAHRVACRSAALVRRVVELGCPVEKACVLRTVVPPEKLVERAVPSDGHVRLVQASRLIPKKGVAVSLRAFARLDLPHAEFVIAGTGPDEAALRELARELGVADRVRFAGFLGQKELKQVFDQSHAFLHPSEGVGGDAEGVPNALLEAMASGLPVVTTRHGGIPEVVKDGENGLLCDEGDPVALAAQISELVGDPVLYKRVAQGGAEMVQREFSEDALHRSLAQIYGA